MQHSVWHTVSVGHGSRPGKKQVACASADIGKRRVCGGLLFGPCARRTKLCKCHLSHQRCCRTDAWTKEPHIAHRWFAHIVVWSVIGQFGLGVYLKLHLEKGILGKIRPLLTKIHKYLGASIPVIGYVQIVLGVIASLGFCYGGELS